MNEGSARGANGGANVGSNEGAHEGRTRRVQGHEGGADVGVCVASYSRTPPPRTLKPLKTGKTYHNIQKLCSCLACASAVCGLQGSSFRGGPRNVPKAINGHNFEPSNLPSLGGPQEDSKRL